MMIISCINAIVFQGSKNSEMVVKQGITCVNVITNDGVEFKGRVLSLCCDSFTLFNAKNEHTKYIRFSDIRDIYYLDPSELLDD